MLLYKTTYPIGNDDGSVETTITKWGGSQTEATKHRVEGKSKCAAYRKPETQTIEVPTNKAGLLEWLNANVTA